jgi:urease accessory protein
LDVKKLNPSLFILRRTIFAFVMLLPALAQAHPGLPAHSQSFISGAAHPLSGLDHLLAMIAVGIFAAQRGGRALWQIPLAFVSVMAAGGILGMTGMGPIPLIEQAIAASVLVLGFLIASSSQLPLRAIVPLVGLFALFHGYAHGAEMPAMASGLIYGTGFLITTVFLHLCGIAVGFAVQRRGSVKMVRTAGCAIASVGVWLVLAG